MITGGQATRRVSAVEVERVLEAVVPDPKLNLIDQVRDVTSGDESQQSGVAPVRIVQRTHGRDARATTASKPDFRNPPPNTYPGRPSYFSLATKSVLAAKRAHFHTPT